MSEPTTNKKRRINSRKYGTVCICCDPKCDETMAKLRKYKPDRHAYFTLPKEPKALHSKLRPDRRIKRDIRSLNRKRILNALPAAATERVHDDEYHVDHAFAIASLHFHDEIYYLCSKRADGRRYLVDCIPAALAMDLNGRIGVGDYSIFTEEDRHADGTYVPLPVPNVVPGIFIWYAAAPHHEAVAGTLEAATTTTATATKAELDSLNNTTPPQTNKKDDDDDTTPTPPVATTIVEPSENERLITENEHLKSKITQMASQHAIEKRKMDERRKELSHNLKLLRDRTRELVQSQREIDAKLLLLKSGKINVTRIRQMQTSDVSTASSSGGGDSGGGIGSGIGSGSGGSLLPTTTMQLLVEDDVGEEEKKGSVEE